MDLSITSAEKVGKTLVTVVGEVDVSNAGELREAVDSALEATPTEVSVDLAEVSYIDSTGIGVLVGAANRAQEAGIAFSVAHPQANVKRVLGLLGVERQLNVED